MKVAASFLTVASAASVSGELRIWLASTHTFCAGGVGLGRTEDTTRRGGIIDSIRK